MIYALVNIPGCRAVARVKFPDGTTPDEIRDLLSYRNLALMLCQRSEHVTELIALFTDSEGIWERLAPREWEAYCEHAYDELHDWLGDERSASLPAWERETLKFVLKQFVRSMSVIRDKLSSAPF